MKIKDTLIVLFIVGAMSLVANAIGTKYTIVEAIPGLLFLIFLAIAGVILAKYLPGRIPAVAYIVTLGCILTYPTMPGSDVINEAVKKSRLFTALYSDSRLCRYRYRQRP